MALFTPRIADKVTKTVQAPAPVVPRTVGNSGGRTPTPQPPGLSYTGYMPGPGTTSSNPRPLPQPVNTSRLDELRQQQLDAQLAAIAANYGSQAAQVQAKLNNVAPTFNAMKLTQQLDAERNRRALEQDIAARNLGRSGIYARNRSELESGITSALAQLVAQWNPDDPNTPENEGGTESQSLMSQLLLLTQGQQHEEIAAQRQAELDRLQWQQYLALLNAGMGTG